MTKTADVIVIGAGMAGASAAAEMSRGAKVVLLESEAQPGHHSTGRSAAIFIPSYGNAAVRQLNRASRPLLESHPFDPEGGGVLSPRGILFLAPADETQLVDQLLAENDGIEEITAEDALKLVPILRREAIVRAAFERDAQDIDVDRLHQIYLRHLKTSGGRLVCNAAVSALSRAGGVWRAETRAGVFEAPVVVNAAGAWADLTAEMAGLAPLGLTPLRRSAAILPAPAGHDIDRWPLAGNAAETYYFKPEAGKLMVSPADETPVDPHDAWPDDMDLAEGLDRFSRAVDYEVTRVERSWAGLRTFAPDRTLVIGFDPAAEGFFWLAGQGGYGIQTAPGAARLAAGLLLEGTAPAGLDPAPFLPARFRS